ncbi:saccharopine dehydrogenase NADP-binding domain-containing protein [Candidatus Uhrbacteria bacterium]|nr:saccharopine dehydrogenase NADP-binding domain-containing protein [Candidatus Uhrbacteria bacterium]
MKYDFLVLGADGMQGVIVVRDLLERGYSVYATDISRSRIETILKKYVDIVFRFLDVRDREATTNAILKSGADVVVNCAEGDWNLDVYQACLETQVHCIDLGSRLNVTKDQLKLDAKFRKIRRTAITGCGSVPGIGNVMLRYAVKKFDTLESVDVGFAWNSNIKKFVVPFSIESVLEEYTLPAPYVINGHWRRRMPIEAAATRSHRTIGEQRAILVDHPETYTFLKYFKPKGLKNIRFYAGFPPHSEQTIKMLIGLGFSSSEPVKIGSVEVKPSEFLTQFLKRHKSPRGYREWENLWVEVTGRKDRKRKKIQMECLVNTMKGWESAGCNIDTGLPASIIAQMVKKHIIKKYGSFAPEAIIPEQRFFRALQRRKMVFYENGKRVHF